MAKGNNIEETVVAIKQDQSSLLQQVSTVVVHNDGDMHRASEWLVQIKARLKRIEEKRVEYTKPLNDQVKVINSDFKALAEPYLEMENSIKRAIGGYVDEQRRIEVERVRKEEAERRKEAERIAQEEDISRRQALAQIEKPKVVEAPKTVKTETAKVVTKQVTKFEIVDPSKVPDEFKVVDERLVRQAVNSGVKRIAGVRIWEETQVSAF